MSTSHSSHPTHLISSDSSDSSGHLISSNPPISSLISSHGCVLPRIEGGKCTFVGSLMGVIKASAAGASLRGPKTIEGVIHLRSTVIVTSVTQLHLIMIARKRSSVMLFSLASMMNKKVHWEYTPRSAHIDRHVTSGSVSCECTHVLAHRYSQLGIGLK